MIPANPRDQSPAAASSTTGPLVFGHPRGLMTLFFTEMWERFTYYGMRALLVLFLADSVRGGFGLDDKTATAIYGLYISVSYILCLPGGWIADRLIGARRAVFHGGVLITIGNLLLALGNTPATFYGGLIVIAFGVGLLKPNVSAMVADLYPEGGGRRDAGFTIFYMGINLGAFLGPIVTGWLAVTYGWKFGFASAAVMMAVGVVQYQLFQKQLGNAGMHVSSASGGSNAEGTRKSWMAVIGVTIAIVIAYLLCLTGVVQIDPLSLAQTTGAVLVAVAALYFAYMFFFASLDAVERKRMVVILFLFIGCALFWAGFEQTGASLNLFAERYVDRTLEAINFEIPTAWFQSVNSVFILIFAAPFSVIWLTLAKRNLNPSAPAKFGFALILLGVGFLFMVAAANVVAGGGKAGPSLLILTYLLHTWGELCLSPVGLSYVTKLAPARYVSQMMGVWFLATSVGNLAAGLLAGMFETTNVAAMPGQYMNFVYFICGAGVVLLLLSKPVKKLMGGVE
ncbi:MAG TPA: peptide MFS transporter [Steroidobacteraceae bacterium]|nr:peptide MFS transporter [Steroidobacteraceae bacterium]